MKTQLKRIDGTLVDESETLTMSKLVENNKSNLSYANLSGADLSYANLSGANIDYSAWPLWCGSKNVKVDKPIAAQIAMHFCWLDCDDPEVKAAQDAVKPLAMQCKHWSEK